MKKRKIQYVAIGCCIALILSVGIGCFYLGRKVETVRYQKEYDLNILLNRSDFEGLSDLEGTIYVTGHKSPDPDTVGSSIAYAHLLRELGYDAVPVVLGKVNNETAFILDAAGAETPELMEDASGRNIVLVDHSEYTQSAEGLKDANVICIIDHHGDGSVTTGNQIIYDARPLGSTATIIWMKFRNYGVALDQKIGTLMLGAILSDTINLQTSTTTSADREAVKVLSDIAGISDTDVFYQEMFQASVSYDGMTDEEIYFSDYKEYEAGGISYCIGCINAYDEETAKDLAERMKKLMSSELETTDMDLAFAMISILHDDMDVTFIVPRGDVEKAVLDEAFGETAAFDGTAYRLEPGISRKKVLVPAITNILEDYPRE